MCAFLTLDQPAGDDPSRPNIAVLITDGYSNNADLTWRTAMAARSAGITIIVIGVGASVRNAELRAIASAPADMNIKQLSSFSMLADNVDVMQALLCPGWYEIEMLNNTSLV
jgi:hypothetical protein